MSGTPAASSEDRGSAEYYGRSTVAVVGLGSVGGIIAGSLCAAGRQDVIACARTPIERLVVERPQDVVDVAIRVLTDPAEAQPADWVFLCTKAHQTDSSAPWLAGLCGPQTRVAVLQNGIGHAERLAPLIGQATVVPTIVYYNGERLAPDRVRFRHAGKYDVAVADDVDGQAFAELLRGTPMRILLSPDFATLAWRKLLINTVLNPVSALTCSVRQCSGATTSRRSASPCSKTRRRSGGPRGRSWPPMSPQILAMMLAFPADAGTSKYFDRMAGRPVEAEALTGAVAAGGRHGLPTPLNRMALTLLRVINGFGLPLGLNRVSVHRRGLRLGLTFSTSTSEAHPNEQRVGAHLHRNKNARVFALAE